MLTPPEKCKNMTELRAAIDLMDAEIATMLAKRSTYIDRAVEIKLEADLPARIDVRVDEVIQKARRNACNAGFDPDLAESLWRQIIEWSIDREETAMAKAK